MKDEFKKAKIENIAMLLQAVLIAEHKVGLMLNVREDHLDEVLEQLPALERPTISKLAEPEWSAVNTIVDSSVVRDLIPQLRAAGAHDIVEYPLNKIVY